MENSKFHHHTYFTNANALSVPNSVWFPNISLKYCPTLLYVTQFCLVNVLTCSMDMKLNVTMGLFVGCFPSDKTMVLFTAWSNLQGIPVHLSKHFDLCKPGHYRNRLSTLPLCQLHLSHKQNTISEINLKTDFIVTLPSISYATL